MLKRYKTASLSLKLTPLGGKSYTQLNGDLTGEICTKWNERESTWRKSGACRSRGTSQSRS